MDLSSKENLKIYLQKLASEVETSKREKEEFFERVDRVKETEKQLHDLVNEIIQSQESELKEIEEYKKEFKAFKEEIKSFSESEFFQPYTPTGKYKGRIILLRFVLQTKQLLKKILEVPYHEKLDIIGKLSTKKDILKEIKINNEDDAEALKKVFREMKLKLQYVDHTLPVDEEIKTEDLIEISKKELCSQKVEALLKLRSNILIDDLIILGEKNWNIQPNLLTIQTK